MSKTDYKFCNLYSFVKKHNVNLYNILEDICAIGLFRPKYPVTFINPNEAAVKKLSSLIDGGKSDVAFEELQKFFIYGKHKDLKKGDFITYNSKVLKSKIGDMVKPNTTFKGWDNRDNVMVFDQTSGDLLEEGDKKERPKLDKKANKTGKAEGGGNDRMKATNKLLLLSSENKIEHVFARHVNGLLVHLKDKDESKFNEVRHYVDPNPVLCWFILVKPSAHGNNCCNYISEEVFDSWYDSMDSNPNNKNAVFLRDGLFEANDFDMSKAKHASEMRKDIETDGCENTANSIISSYGDRLKLLEDELRFRFSDSEFSEKDSAIAELKGIEWDEPDSATILFKNFKGSLCTSAIHGIMIKFKDSNVFHYSMLNDNVHKKLQENIRGAGSKKIISVLGNKGRKLIKNMDDSDDEKEISKFLSSLNKKQVVSLKKLLNNM